MGQPVVHFQVSGKDASRLQRFYSDLFDWKLAPPLPPEMGSYAMVEGESGGIAGGIGEMTGDEPRVTFYVQVPDLQAAIDKAVAMGGSAVRPPIDMPGIVAMAEFFDPDGNVIGLVRG